MLNLMLIALSQISLTLPALHKSFSWSELEN